MNLTESSHSSNPSVLFVCTANICRSPMATALLRARLMQRTDLDWHAWRVESAGTWAGRGQPASTFSQVVMQDRRLDISQHRSRPISSALLDQFNLILTMELGQKEAILVEFPQTRGKVFTLSEMAGEDVPIDDPYGGTLQDYEDAVSNIDAWLEAGMNEIVRRAL